MTKLKSTFAIIITTAFFYFFSGAIDAQTEPPVNIYFFRTEGCPHCEAEEKYLSELKSVYKEKILILDFELTKSAENREILRNAAQKLDIKTGSVPITIIGSKVIYGYGTDQTTGVEIKSTIDACLTDSGNNVNLPILGNINPKLISLPFLALVVGLLDGFNPCAMWTLLFLISILLGMKDKKRRWILGIAFILASGFVYFLFMVAWLNLFLFLGFVVWIRILIGAGAVVFGIFSAHKYFKDREGGCETAEDEKRQKIFEKIKSITRKDQFIFALFGIILLAAAVNLVELVCSAGFPAIYTGILSLHNLPRISYYLYLLLSIFFFILDDIIVFVIAMVTLEAVGIQSKYARISSLVGGIILTIIGILLILKPGVLMLNL